ncbi:MAG: uroporphyrinogen-III C-methyltransferase [Deltaproteobacteria bacterium]|nr:uroporphyrinogen-III C-methyltransferase [Deltaproteobacteria bacterium]
MKGRVVFVGAGPGAPDLITVRGYLALMEADTVLYDSLVDERIREGSKAEWIFVGKRCGRHSMKQEAITELLASLALGGHKVVRLKGGDPTVLGRTGEEALRLVELDIPFEIVPGVTSAVAAPAFAGIPITHRGLADSFCVVSAHRREDDVNLSIPPFHDRTTLVLLMAAQTVEKWIPLLRLNGYPADLPVAFVSSASTEEQKVLTTTVGRALMDIKGSHLESPVMAVIGQVVTLRAALKWFARDAKTEPRARRRRSS